MRRLILAALLLAGPMASPAGAQPAPAVCTFYRGDATPDEPCLAALAPLVQAWTAAQAAGGSPVLVVVGHAADQQGPRIDYLLSHRRAASVAEALTRLGVPATGLDVSAAATPENTNVRQRIDRSSRKVEVSLRLP